MSLRVCIMGNSHVACLRQAHAAEPGRWPGLDARFLGAHKGLLLETAERDRHLVPTSPEAAEAFRTLGGIPALPLDDFDAFVVAGCLVSFATVANVHRHARWLGLPSLAEAENIAACETVLMSEAAVEEAAAELISARLGCRVVRHLGKMTARPILLTSQPRISAIVADERRRNTQTHRTIRRKGDTEEMSRLFDECAAEAVSRSGGYFLPQPAHTRARDILTKRAYMDGAVRLTSDGNTPQPAHDIAHANARYGAAVLDQIAEALDAA